MPRVRVQRRFTGPVPMRGDREERQRQPRQVIHFDRDASLLALDQLQDQLSIDRDNLERACMRQPDLLYQVAEQVAIHRSRRDAAKKELEEKEASLYIELRRAAAMLEERVTEAEIKAQMTTKREHQVLTAKLAEANELLSRWEVLKEAFSQRSYMLRELCQLYLARYYGGDVVGGAERRAMRNVATAELHRARQERNGRDRE